MTTHETLPAPLTPRRLYAGLWVAAGVLYGALIALGRPLLGVAAFLGLGAGAVAYRARAPRPLFDERDATRRGQSAVRTFRIVGMASAVFFPTMVVLWALGYHGWPPWLNHLGLTVAALYGLYGAVTLHTRWRA